MPADRSRNADGLFLGFFASSLICGYRRDINPAMLISHESISKRIIRFGFDRTIEDNNKLDIIVVRGQKKEGSNGSACSRRHDNSNLSIAKKKYLQ